MMTEEPVYVPQFKLHLHMKSGHVTTLRPCEEFDIESQNGRTTSIQAMGCPPAKKGDRYALLETIHLADIDFIEVEVL
jgi:hypothetical protein